MKYVRILDREKFNKYSSFFLEWNVKLDFPYIYFPNDYWTIVSDNVQYYSNNVYVVSVTIHKTIKYKDKNIFDLKETKYRWGNMEYHLKYFIYLSLPRELVCIIQSFLGDASNIILA